MTFQAHLKRDLLLVFVNDGDSQPENDNNEIDRRACCGERCDPATLTAALITDPGTACSSNLPGFAQGGHGVICECIEILRIFAVRSAGSAFVINEHANILGRKKAFKP